MLKQYVAEANFFEKVLENDISELPGGSHVIEIGAGIGLLALNLAARGFKVTAFEPESSGFTEMHQIREGLISNWHGTVPDVEFRDTYIDASTVVPRSAEYIYAINVIEHVPNYADLIANALRLRARGGYMRIICPNYTIPYEPHFELPIIFSKGITSAIFRNKITRSKISNPIEFWNDLSWPSPRKLKKLFEDSGITAEFSRDATHHYIDRALTDPDFIERKGPIIGTSLRIFAFTMKHLTHFIPISLIPIIDCRISDKNNSKQK